MLEEIKDKYPNLYAYIVYRFKSMSSGSIADTLKLKTSQRIDELFNPDESPEGADFWKGISSYNYPKIVANELLPKVDETVKVYTYSPINSFKIKPIHTFKKNDLDYCVSEDLRVYKKLK